MHTNQVESPGLVCLGRGDDLKNGKKMRFARSGPFSQILSHISNIPSHLELIRNLTLRIALFSIACANVVYVFRMTSNVCVLIPVLFNISA